MLYALLSSLSYTVQNVGCKEYGRRFPGRVAGLLLMTLLAMLAMCAVLAIGGVTALTGSALIIAVGFGVGFVLTFLCMTSAMAAGPLGLTALITNCSMLVPMVVGLLFWNEQLTWAKGLGAAAILVMLVLSGLGSRDEKQGGVQWLLLTLGALLGNGVLSILQHFMAESPEVSARLFTFWTSLFGAAACALALAVFLIRGGSLAEWTGRAGELSLCSLAVGLGTAGGNTFAISVLTALPAIVAFPLRQGLLVLIVWLVGRLIYRDPAGRYDWPILILGLAGIILMNV